MFGFSLIFNTAFAATTLSVVPVLQTLMEYGQLGWTIEGTFRTINATAIARAGTLDGTLLDYHSSDVKVTSTMGAGLG